MNPGNWLCALLLSLAFSTVVSAQQPQLKPTAQESADLKLLLAEASAAVNALPPDGSQTSRILELARTYWRSGDHAGARAEIQRLRKEYEALSEANASGQSPPPGARFGPNPIVQLSTLAWQVAEFGDTADALDILKQIGNAGMAGQALETIAIRQAEAGDSQGAAQTVLRMAAGEEREFAFGEVIFTNLQHHDISGALAAVNQMAASPEKVHALVSISHAQKLAGDHASAMRSVAEAQEVAFQLPESMPPGPQNFSVSYICSPRPAQSPRDQALPYAAEGQWDLGDHAAAMATRGQIKSPSLKEQALYNFVKVSAENNKFTEAGQLAAQLQPGACRNQALGVLAQAQVAAGDIDGAVKRVSEIQPPPSENMWAELALKAKDPAAAKMLFARARSAALNAPTEIQQANALYGVAALESSGSELRSLYCADSAEAIRLAREAQAKRQRPPTGLMGSMANISGYAKVNHLANCGKLEQAKALALSQEGTRREEDLGNVAALQAANGDVEGAIKWAQSLASPADRASASEGVVDSIVRQMTMRAHKK